jgi:hypothetical protein
MKNMRQIIILNYFCFYKFFLKEMMEELKRRRSDNGKGMGSVSKITWRFQPIIPVQIMPQIPTLPAIIETSRKSFKCSKSTRKKVFEKETKTGYAWIRGMFLRVVKYLFSRKKLWKNWKRYKEVENSFHIMSDLDFLPNSQPMNAKKLQVGSLFCPACRWFNGKDLRSIKNCANTEIRMGWLIFQNKAENDVVLSTKVSRTNILYMYSMLQPTQ